MRTEFLLRPYGQCCRSSGSQPIVHMNTYELDRMAKTIRAARRANVLLHKRVAHLQLVNERLSERLQRLMDRKQALMDRCREALDR